jgi:hypothetical protein
MSSANPAFEVPSTRALAEPSGKSGVSSDSEEERSAPRRGCISNPGVTWKHYARLFDRSDVEARVRAAQASLGAPRRRTREVTPIADL